jgi:hypothetical protein
VIPSITIGAKAAPLLKVIASKDFHEAVTEAGGYDTSQTGTTTFVGGTG